MLGHKRLSLYSFHESHSAEANSGFCSMKQLVVLISFPPPPTPSPPLLGGMLVHHRLPLKFFSGFPKVHQYLNTLLAKEKRETEDYESEVSHPKDTTQQHNRCQTQTTWPRAQLENLKPQHLQYCKLYLFNQLIIMKSISKTSNHNTSEVLYTIVGPSG